MNKDISSQLYPIPVTNSKNYLILFLLWPFLAFLLAVKNYSQKEAKNVVYLFLIYYGLNYVIGTEYYSDAAGYAMNLKTNALLPFSDFFKIISGLYSTEHSVDIIEPLISFIVSRFTDNHRFLFAVFAAVFGFFYLRSINLLYNRYMESPEWNVILHLAFFTILIPITSINGFRMWTAAWMFFYAAYHVVLYRDARYILLAFGSSFVHWSFITANVILIIYYFAGNRNFIYYPIVVASFVLPQLLSPIFQTLSLFLGGTIQSRFESYANEEYMMMRQGFFETASWFLRLSNDLVLYYLLFAIIIIQLRHGYLMKDKPEKNLFSFLLLFLAFVNFGKGIPSFGGRFQIVFFLFATLYVFLYFVKLSEKRFNIITWLGLFPMLLYAVVTFRTVSQMINPWIFTPGLGLPFLAPGISIADFLFH